MNDQSKSGQSRKHQRRPLTGMGADVFFATPPETEEKPLNTETVEPADRTTVTPSETPVASHELVKTSFYPTRDQIDKLDDLAAEYNRRYRRQRHKIDRQDIIRYLIDQCSMATLADLDIQA